MVGGSHDHPLRSHCVSVIEIQQTGRVRTLRLNRPATTNALSEELAWGIVHAVKAAQADQDTRVIAITGNGRGFCAGLDLTPASGMGQQDLYLDVLHWVSRLCFHSGDRREARAAFRGKLDPHFEGR